MNKLPALGADPYKDSEAQLRLSDIPKKKKLSSPKLSVMMSTFHRYSQLERSLECLCRQNWKEFEVLICDDGDIYDLFPIFEKFEPYLHLKHFRRERTTNHVDPTGGFKFLFPYAKGEIWAIMQPELMLHPNACQLLYKLHFEKIKESVVYYMMGKPEENAEIWVALKPYFFSPLMQLMVDTVDWHKNIENLHELPEFYTKGCGLSNETNAYWMSKEKFPWWFIGSTRREAEIWEHMPEMVSHASIDFYLLNYRRICNYIDIVPYQPLAYHQDHHRLSFGIDGEKDNLEQYILDKTGRKLPIE